MNFLDNLSNLNVNKNGGMISLHKPLLLLLVISEIKKGRENRFSYEEIEPKLKNLLKKYGLKNTKTYNPHLPFIHLSSDQNLWHIEGPQIIAKGPKPTDRSHLKDANGFLSNEFAEFLQSPNNTNAAVNLLLSKYWTEAYHDEIANELGLDAHDLRSLPTTEEKRKRSKIFVEHVMDAYEEKCAICNQSIKLANALIGIDACHVRPIQHNGDDLITNGIALCKIHHWALDRGAIAITKEFTLEVSPMLEGYKIEDHFHQYKNKQIFTPRESSWLLQEKNVDYHRECIFVG